MRILTPYKEEKKFDMERLRQVFFTARRILPAEEYRLGHLPRPDDSLTPAVERIAEQKAPILIWGDYDVDGTTGAAALAAMLRGCGKDAVVHIPLRREGYGLDGTRAVTYMREIGATLLITVDCGITDADEVDVVKAAGHDVIITDHHLPLGRLPNALIVDAQLWTDSPWTGICGAATAWLLGSLCLSRMKGNPELKKTWLDFIAFATVADVVPLTQVNRILYHAGMREGIRSPFLRVMSEGEDGIASSDIAYRYAPMINAFSRMGADENASLPAMYVETDTVLCREHVLLLREINEMRKTTEREGYARLEGSDGVYVCPAGYGTLLGIMAARKMEETGLPAIVLDAETMAGSGRSFGDFFLPEVLDAIRKETGSIDAFGGHAHAVGGVHAVDVEAFRAAFGKRLALWKKPHTDSIIVDGIVPLAQITRELMSIIEDGEPYGNGNPEPVFLSVGLRIVGYRRLGKDDAHCRFSFEDRHGDRHDAVWFFDNHIGDTLVDRHERFAVIYAPVWNAYNGFRSISLHIKGVFPENDIEICQIDEVISDGK